jgi:hypothetical protein
MTNEKILTQVGDVVKELKGEELESFLQEQAKNQLEEASRQLLIEENNQAKKQILESAIAKLAKLGLTEDEAKAVIGIQ